MYKKYTIERSPEEREQINKFIHDNKTTFCYWLMRAKDRFRSRLKLPNVSVSATLPFIIQLKTIVRMD